MPKADFLEKFKAARQAFQQSIAGLTDAEAARLSAGSTQSRWPSIKAILGHLAAWEREVLIADEMTKRGEESNLDHLESLEFNQTQETHRQNWPLDQLLSELDLNYEALLMAWDEYEGEDGPYGTSSWQPGPLSLWWLITHPQELTAEIARRRAS